MLIRSLVRKSGLRPEGLLRSLASSTLASLAPSPRGSERAPCLFARSFGRAAFGRRASCARWRARRSLRSRLRRVGVSARHAYSLARSEERPSAGGPPSLAGELDARFARAFAAWE